MMYQPINGNYESGLTAKLLYELVDDLLKKDIAKERTNDDRNPALGPEKLWMQPEIRSELEEFVWSYYFGGLDSQLVGFAETFKGEIFSDELSDRYMKILEEEYESKNSAREAIASAYDAVANRRDKLQQEIEKIAEYCGEGSVKMNARDAFAHLAFIYVPLEFVKERLEKSPQS